MAEADEELVWLKLVRDVCAEAVAKGGDATVWVEEARPKSYILEIPEILGPVVPIEEGALDMASVKALRKLCGSFVLYWDWFSRILYPCGGQHLREDLFLRRLCGGSAEAPRIVCFLSGLVCGSIFLEMRSPWPIAPVNYLHVIFY